jgi:hypothetical protein
VPNPVEGSISISSASPTDAHGRQVGLRPRSPALVGQVVGGERGLRQPAARRQQVDRRVAVGRRVEVDRHDVAVLLEGGGAAIVDVEQQLLLPLVVERRGEGEPEHRPGPGRHR